MPYILLIRPRLQTSSAACTRDHRPMDRGIINREPISLKGNMTHGHVRDGAITFGCGPMTHNTWDPCGDFGMQTILAVLYIVTYVSTLSIKLSLV